MARQRSTAAPLADPAALAARHAALDDPAWAPLRTYAAAIRAAHGPTPDFDPADGGTGARILLLLETPGPAIGQTGLVSMDNATGTGANLRRFLAAAGLHRADLAIWNTVPWIIHAGGLNRAPRQSEIRAGLACLPGLLPLLPHLVVIVLAGRVAGLAGPMLAGVCPDLRLVRVPHPSPTFVCTHPDIPLRIVAGLTEAARLSAQSASPSLAGCR